MPKYHTSWRVLPHQEIQELEENLWRVQGSLEGMGLRRVMTIARLPDGALVIHNGIALDDESMARIEAWGHPAFILVPNGYHRLDAHAFKRRYPLAKVLCPKGALKRVAQVVDVDGSYEDFPANKPVRLETLQGVAEAEGAMMVTSQSGVTLVLNDILFNMPHGKGVAGFVFRHLTQSTGGPRISRVVRWFVMKDRKALKQHLTQLSQIPRLKRIIVSHHRVITESPAATLRSIAATL
jgi:hypothetical protein